METGEKIIKQVEVALQTEYDTGYGDVSADLVADVCLLETGELVVKNGVFFLVDQDGGNFGEREYERTNYDECLIDLAVEKFKKEKEVVHA